MPAANYDILIEQGATFRLQLAWKDGEGDPIDLTGYSARMQVRPRASSDQVLVALVSGDGITLGDDGSIVVLASAERTEAVAGKRAVYDLELESADGTVTRLIQGGVNISPEVTR
jgi:hypothetical protein